MQLKRTSVTPYPDIVIELTRLRDHHAAIVKKELQNDPSDYAIINPNQELATRYFQAAETILKLAEQNEQLRECTVHRLILELQNVRSPDWIPTHQHYKGDYYRVTGTRWDAEHDELIECVEYDDAQGKKFVMTKRRWESQLESGQPRYRFLFDTSTKPA